MGSIATVSESCYPSYQFSCAASWEDPQPTIFEHKTDEELASSLKKVLVRNKSFQSTAISEDHEATHTLFMKKLDKAVEEIKESPEKLKKGLC